MAVHLYAADNDGAFPKALTDLLDAQVLTDTKLLIWRHPNTGLELQWAYTQGLDNKAPGALPLFRSPRSIEGSYVVGFVDGSARMVKESELELLRSKIKTYLSNQR